MAGYPGSLSLYTYLLESLTTHESWKSDNNTLMPGTRVERTTPATGEQVSEIEIHDS